MFLCQQKRNIIYPQFIFVSILCLLLPIIKFVLLKYYFLNVIIDKLHENQLMFHIGECDFHISINFGLLMLAAIVMEIVSVYLQNEYLCLIFSVLICFLCSICCFSVKERINLFFETNTLVSMV